jgi:hypothetical protein
MGLFPVQLYAKQMFIKLRKGAVSGFGRGSEEPGKQFVTVELLVETHKHNPISRTLLTIRYKVQP